MDHFTNNARLKKLGRMLAVTAIVWFLLIAFSFLFYPKDNCKAFGMNDEKANGIIGEKDNSIDVVFLGDSEALCSFSPLQMWGDFGFTSYVCATSGQQLPYGNTLLRRATENQKPTVIVFETNAIYRPTTLEFAFKRAVEDVLPIFEYHNRWKSLSIDDISSSISASKTDKLKGFSIRKDVKPADASTYMAPNDQIAEIPVLNKLCLHSMVNYCRSIGATPVLVSTPSTVNWNTARHNGMKEFAHELGVAYLDLNVGPTKVDIDWNTETADAGDHLNLAGAKKVSNYIGGYLSRFYKLKDHRDDKAYNSWNKALMHYRKKTS